MPKYVCNNHGSCPAAGLVIEMPLGAELVCPDDGYALEEVLERNSKKHLVIGGIVASVIVAAGAGWSLLVPEKTLLPPSNPTQSPASTPTPSTSNGMSPDAAQQASAKRDVDERILTSSGTGAATNQKAVIAREYIKAAIPFLQEGKWQEADAQLLKAKSENPDEPLVYINQAISHLKQARENEAISALETAFQKGFKDFAAIEVDVDLKSLTSRPKYVAMAASYKSKTSK